MNSQLSIFDVIYPKFKIDKPIRLIELFAGYGSQALALKYLNVPFEHWKICEWAVKSIQAYKDIHFTDDTDYSKTLNKEQLQEFLFNKGISSNYNEPMTFEQIKRLPEQQIRTIYNNIVTTHNLVNIQQVKGKDLEIVDTDKYCYIMCYSFPCQDLSLAGKGKGMSDTSTRSGMLWEVERILTECENKPQVLLMENVPHVHGADNVEDFNKWQLRLEELGYKNYWEDLIATDYGIPQTRNRCFMVSILGNYSYTFPPKQELKLKLKDMLEDNVDEKYYLSDAMINYVCSRMPTGDNKITTGINMGNRETFKKAGTLTTGEGSKASSNYIIENNDYDYSKKEGRIINKHLRETLEQNNKKIKDGSYIDAYNRMIRDDDLSGTISTRTDAGNDTYVAFIKDTENYIEWEDGKNIQMNCRAWKDDKVIVTLNTGGETKILIKNATKKGYLEAEDGDEIDISSRMEYHRGNVQKGKAQTLSTMGGENVGVITNDLKIRKLTPKECFRLMGVKDEDYEKCAKNQSNASLYHLAGDSIVVNVLMAIFKELL